MSMVEKKQLHATLIVYYEDYRNVCNFRLDNKTQYNTETKSFFGGRGASKKGDNFELVH
jgi:hypothetical protein